MRLKVILLLVMASIPAFAVFQGVAQAATFTVNSTGDAGDSIPGDGLCSDGAGNCTLRAAIEEANTTTETDTIGFDIPITDIGYASSTDSFLIQPLSALPAISEPVIIDGYTQPGASPNTNGPGLGSNTVLKIELGGSNAGPFTTGLQITAGNSVVRGLAINRFNASGVELSGNGGNLIEGSFIGIDVTGAVGLGNGLYGVLAQNSSSNIIGGTTEAARNVISANVNAGIIVLGATSGENLVQGNFIGADLTGAVALGNLGGGVSILNSPDNAVGGTEPGAGNIISANNQNGVTIYGPASTGNLVQGNFIGADPTGAADLGNGLYGVLVQDAPGNTVGGTTEAARNLISGNQSSGVVLLSPSATGNLVQGNFIGTDFSGTAALPNGIHGVIIDDAPQNLVGGLITGARNIISGNEESGVVIGGSHASGNVVVGNFIGTDLSGAAGLGNDLNGVLIQDATFNVIGGTVTEARNVISGNGRDGVVILGSASAFNVAQGNFIGADLTGSAPLGNGADGVAILDASINTIGGPEAGASNVISSNSGNGILIVGSDASNNVMQGNLIGTDLAGVSALGNSAAGVNILNSSNNVVGGTAPGAGNIISANGGTGITISGVGSTGNLVQGNLIGADSTGTIALGNGVGGVFINNASLNIVGGVTTEARNIISGNLGAGVSIQNGLASGNLVLGNHIGADASGAIALGNELGVLIVGAPKNVIGGTDTGAGNVISANNVGGVSISGSNATGNLVQGNLIGTDSTGTAALGNNLYGVIIGNAPANTIGGAAPQAGNLISGNIGAGIAISGAGSAGNLVLGNHIGADVTGTVALGNSSQGVSIVSAPSNTIGGGIPGARNIISGNGGGGILVAGGGATGNRVQGSYIGADITGNATIPNNGGGVTVTTDDNVIGGPAPGEGNLIVGNAGTGVSISLSSGNSVWGNFIGTNATSTPGIGNTKHGVAVFNSADNAIGGDSAPGEGNVISGNGGAGVLIAGASSTGNEVRSNAIGTDFNGAATMGNGSHGVMILDSASNNTIGNASSSVSNIIAFNGGDGVNASSGDGNAFLSNSIFSNTRMGIDLGGLGLTSNDEDDADSGVNNLQNYPYMTSLEIDVDGDLVIKYSVDSEPGYSIYPLLVEFFIVDEDGEEGKTPLGADIYPEASAQAMVTANLGNAATLGAENGQLIVATATDAGGNTSEFSQPAMMVGGPPPPLCDGQPATMFGTDGADVLIGTIGDDVIVGLGGNDFILGLNGRDILCGEGGSDFIDGGAGDDILVGGPNSDILSGGQGEDVINCGSGFDFAHGGTQTDTATLDCEFTALIP